MKNVPSVQQGEICDSEEIYLIFNDGSTSRLLQKAFIIPGMMGGVHVNKVNIVSCEIEKPLEIQFFLKDVDAMYFKTTSNIKKITKDIIKSN